MKTAQQYQQLQSWYNSFGLFAAGDVLRFRTKRRNAADTTFRAKSKDTFSTEESVHTYAGFLTITLGAKSARYLSTRFYALGNTTIHLERRSTQIRMSNHKERAVTLEVIGFPDDSPSKKTKITHKTTVKITKSMMDEWLMSLQDADDLAMIEECIKKSNDPELRRTVPAELCSICQQTPCSWLQVEPVAWEYVDANFLQCQPSDSEDDRSAMRKGLYFHLAVFIHGRGCGRRKHTCCVESGVRRIFPRISDSHLFMGFKSK